MDNKNEKSGFSAKASYQQSQKHMQNIRMFLETFKTKQCTRQDVHFQNDCFYWHDHTDKRRCPYEGTTFAYSQFREGSCVELQSQKYENCLNDFERIYHPVNYRTQACGNYECSKSLMCPFEHEEDRAIMEYGQFFRFDLNSFKTKACGKKGPKNNKYPDDHQRKVCVFYHNDSDKRRPFWSNYSHMMCANTPYNCSANCTFSHNRIEQLYHPSRYKSKFCKFYPNKVVNCEFREFCSFAHTQSEIMIRLIHLEDRNPDFYMYIYKTVWCPYTQNHDRANCVYAHNFQDYRRNPSQYKYKPEKCSYWNFLSDDIKSIQQAGCKNGMKCDKSHGWMEPKFHPHVYKKNKHKKQIQGSDNSLIQHEKHKIFHKYSGILQIGSPFFKLKADREISQTSKKTKAKTVNNTSDRSNDGSSVRDRDEFVKSQKVNEDAVSLVLMEQSHLWRDLQIPQTQAQNSEQILRAKSLGKTEDYDISYSKSIKDMFEETSILQKLKFKRISELKIINLKQSQIKKLEFLNSTQKDILARKIHEYGLKRDPKVIKYSQGLTKYFVKKNCQQILEKMKNRKVKQQKLLNLLSQQINELSFLTNQEKQELPKVIREFSNNKEFDDLNKLIIGETQNVQS